MIETRKKVTGQDFRQKLGYSIGKCILGIGERLVPFEEVRRRAERVPCDDRIMEKFDYDAERKLLSANFVGARLVSG